MENNNVLEEVKGTKLLREQVNYVDKKTGEHKSFYLYYVQINGIKVKATLNREQLDIVEQVAPLPVELVK